MGIWLITGCSGGLGRGIAEAALKHGEYVAVTARRPETLQELTEKYPECALPLRLDLNDRENMKQGWNMNRQEAIKDDTYRYKSNRCNRQSALCRIWQTDISHGFRKAVCVHDA